MVWNYIIGFVILVSVDFKIDNTYCFYSSLDWVIIVLGNGLLPVRHQAIIYSNDDFPSYYSVIWL